MRRRTTRRRIRKGTKKGGSISNALRNASNVLRTTNITMNNLEESLNKINISKEEAERYFPILETMNGLKLPHFNYESIYSAPKPVPGAEALSSSDWKKLGQLIDFLRLPNSYFDAWFHDVLRRAWSTQTSNPLEYFYPDYGINKNIMEYGILKKYVHNLCTLATRRGQWDFLKWAYQFGFPFYEGTCEMAAERGRLTILKWLRSIGCPWDIHATGSAAAANELEMLKWLIENGCPYSKDMLLHESESYRGQPIYDYIRTLK